MSDDDLREAYKGAAMLDYGDDEDHLAGLRAVERAARAAEREAIIALCDQYRAELERAYGHLRDRAVLSAVVDRIRKREEGGGR